MSAGGYWGDPTHPPTTVSGGAVQAYEVVTVNGDGTVDLRNTSSRATRSRVQPPPGYTPAIRDIVLVADVGGNTQRPAITQVLTAANDPVGDRLTALEHKTTAELYDDVETAEAMAGVTTYQDLATVGPQVTIAVAGDYWVEWGAYCQPGTAAPIYTVFATVKEDANAASDTKALFWQKLAGTGAYGPDSGAQVRGKRVDGLAVGAVLKVQYRQTAGFAGTVAFQNRWLRARLIA